MKKTLLITHIDWDLEGMKIEDCGLPTAVLVVNAPDNWTDEGYRDDMLGCELADVYGFNHYGFEVCDIRPDSKQNGRMVWDQHKNLAIMQAPEY